MGKAEAPLIKCSRDTGVIEVKDPEALPTCTALSVVPETLTVNVDPEPDVLSIFTIARYSYNSSRY